MNLFPDDQQSGYVDITCYFAKESDAKGCRIVAQPPLGNDSTKPCEFAAAREGRDESTVTVALPSGTYKLMVYDDEDEAGHNPAFATTLSVQSSQVSGRVQHFTFVPAYDMNHSTECTSVANNDKLPSQSTTPTKYIICKFMQNIPLARSNKHALSPNAVIVTLASSIILIAGVATAIIFMCVCKRKGKELLMVTMCLTVSTILIRRERWKGTFQCMTSLEIFLILYSCNCNGT